MSYLIYRFAGMKEHHKRRYLKYLTTKIQHKRNKKITKYSLRAISQYQANDQDYRSLFQRLAKKQPLKIHYQPIPSFSLPSRAQVIIDQRPSKNTPDIPYGKSSPEILFRQIPMDQFTSYKGQWKLSIAQMRLNIAQVKLPSFINEYFQVKRGGIVYSNIQAINLWYYKGRRISGWHYDGHDNFLIMIEGRKQIYLAPPNVYSSSGSMDDYGVSKSVFDVNHNHALSDHFQGLQARDKIRCIIEKGECLFIPRGWWHYVKSQGQSNIALNVWGNSIKQLYTLKQQQMMLKHLIFEMSNRCYKELNKDRQEQGEQQSVNGDAIRKNIFGMYVSSCLM